MIEEQAKVQNRSKVDSAEIMFEKKDNPSRKSSITEESASEKRNSSSKKSSYNEESTKAAKDTNPTTTGSLRQLQTTQEYNINNPYLTEGYRLRYKRCRDVTKTLFMWHNETLNIWTHLVGAMFMVAAAVWILCNFDKCYDKYNEMTDFIKNFHADWIGTNIYDVSESVKSVFDQEFQNIEIFYEKLSGIMEELADAKSAIAQNLLDSLDKLIQSKDDLQTFVINFYSDISKSDMMKKFAEYHKILIDIENSIVKLQEHIEEKTQDFEKILWLRTLAKYMPIREVYHNLPVWPIVFYCFTATFCLGVSAAYHWFYIKSKRVFTILGRMDLSGIVVLIFGSVVPLIYYTFYCQKMMIFFYTLFYQIVCTVTFFLSITDWFNDRKQRGLKGITYGSVGILAGMICFHCGIQGLYAGPGSDYVLFSSCGRLVMCMGATYLTGLVFYIFHIPESCFNCGEKEGGKYAGFFKYFNSHCIWHLFVFGAAVIHFFAVINLYNARLGVTCNK